MSTVPVDPTRIDVGSLLDRTVTSLYAHLVTRPTGRAVRMAIEARLADAGERSISVIDLSEVSILDFSCADEVVAKLLQRYADEERHEAYFVFSGVQAPHRDQVVVVLERQGLAAVAQTEPGRFELLGEGSDSERSAWDALERVGTIATEDVGQVLPGPHERSALDDLTRRRLAFRHPDTDAYHALSRLVAHLL